MFGTLIPRRERPIAMASPDRWSQTINRMETEFEDLLDRVLGTDGARLNGTTFVPTMDLAEAENQYEVTVDLPGLKPEDVSVELKEGDLWIIGKREEQKEEKDRTYHRLERRQGEFRRVVRLPAAIDPEKVEAHFADGVLRVTIPKTEEAKAKHIEVQA